MHFASHLLAILLTVAPASVYAKKDCQHWRTVFDIGDCKNTVCPSQKLDKFKDGFEKNKVAWEAWANDKRNGGTCGGYCEVPVEFTPPNSIGTTWKMNCYAHLFELPLEFKDE
ncbi:hypothetical protein FKW77_005102 [Venturia effusa]|uniref:Secreted protein n=1 Tax=Venturia effusa TaxID=50376 RepID=A0A517LFF9_9PEZI|nr:hypothetical protein FKW77_005102 [Venturia effusa]